MRDANLSTGVRYNCQSCDYTWWTYEPMQEHACPNCGESHAEELICKPELVLINGGKH